MQIVKDLSPNFWEGWDVYKPIGVVLHITEGTFSSSKSWLKSPASNASSHYLVGDEIHQLVEEKNRAWHAGKIVNPKWKGLIPVPLGSITNPIKDLTHYDTQFGHGEQGSQYIHIGGGAVYLNPNNYTLGIEVALTSGTVVPSWKTWTNVAWLVRDICKRYGWTINELQVIHHNEIRADKTCPGWFITRNYMKALSMFV